MIKRKSVFRGVAEPFAVQEPLLVRFCRGLVDNLATILRTALVLGAVILMQDLKDFMALKSPPVADAVPEIAAPAVTEPREPSESIITEGVELALNCTFTEFRNAHYDECVQDDSSIYKRPGAAPDDTGQVFEPSASTLYAHADLSRQARR